MSDRWLFLLLTQAWQLTLVIVVVAILSRRIARQRPHLAVALWLIVLAKSITPPVWSSPLGVFSWTILTSSPAPVEIAPLSSTWRPVAANVDLLSLDPLPEPPAELLSSPEESSESTAVVAAPPLPAIAFPDVERTPIELRRWSRAAALLAIWLSGAALTLLVICSRLLHLWRTLSRAGVGPDAELAGHVETLRKRLMLRRHVRVWVTPTDHGPAVLGLFRPWLLLPKTLVDSVSPDDLEPLLAHELLHIRRGDLWIGRWQALVQAAWWPHPLVWWSNRVLTRQLERCCDEEVLAELGCEPGRYARGLLKALELKHRLRPVPAAPGVRPVDLTAERMERIMRMGQGSRRRTPWWCWAVLGTGLLVALPGAGLKLGAEEPGQVLFGVGVNSEAELTGTVVLGEEAAPKPDDSSPADATRPGVGIGSEQLVVRADAIRVSTRSTHPTDPERNAPLDQRVTMTIKDRPLDDLLAELAPKYKISFVIDMIGLEEEGVLSSVPVSGEFHDVTLRTMLTLLVESHNLVAHEQDRVLKFTSRGRVERLEVRTYSVADFLVPFPGTDADSSKSSDPRNESATPTQRAKDLIDLVHSTVQPDSWEDAGGKGQIRFFESTLSLVIRQKQRVHEQIAELFNQLRRRHDAQISLQLVDLALTAEEWKALSPDGRRQTVLEDGAADLSAANSRKATFFNGQRATLSSELDRRNKAQASLLSFDVIPVIAEDQKSVALILLPTSHLSRFIPRSINIPDGLTALVDISDTLPAGDPAVQNGKRVVLQITPRVIVPEEPREANKEPLRSQSGIRRRVGREPRGEGPKGEFFGGAGSTLNAGF